MKWSSLHGEFVSCFLVFPSLNSTPICPRLRQYWQMKSRAGQRQREEKSRREKIRGKSRMWGPGGSTSRLAKAAGAEPAGEMRAEKAHAVVARSTFPNQNVQNTSASDHFWKLRCRKSARRCGAKQISKSKCTKHLSFGPLSEVEMSEKCTPLWREAQFEVKMYKTPHVRATFGGSDVVSRGRRKGLCTLSKVSKTWGFCSIFNYNHHYTTLHSNTLHYNYNLHCNLHFNLHYNLHYIPLHYTTLN